MAEMKSLTIKGKYYEIVDEHARNTIERTYSIFYADTTVPYPMEEGHEVIVTMSKLSNEGSGVKVGDLAVASNGALCKVIAVAQETGRVTLFAIASIGGSANNGTPGTPGYSIYYMNVEVEYPYEGSKFFAVNQTNLSNSGSGVKIGDLLVSSNGVICNVTKVSANAVNYEPVAKIGSDGENGKDGKDGFSIHTSSTEIFYSENATFVISLNTINTYERDIQIGDHIIFKNGVIADVISFDSSGIPTVKPVLQLSGGNVNTQDIVNAVLDALPTWTGGSY